VQVATFPFVGIEVLVAVQIVVGMLFTALYTVGSLYVFSWDHEYAGVSAALGAVLGGLIAALWNVIVIVAGGSSLFSGWWILVMLSQAATLFGGLYALRYTIRKSVNDQSSAGRAPLLQPLQKLQATLSDIWRAAG